MEKFATDVGGVLKKRKRFPGDKRVCWMPCAEWALNRLAEIRELYIISYVSSKTAMKMSKRNLRNSFVKEYIPEDRWHFVFERKQKVDVMLKNDIPILVDNRKDIIDWVREAGLQGILFGSVDSPDWKSVVEKIMQE